MSDLNVETIKFVNNHRKDIDVTSQLLEALGYDEPFTEAVESILGEDGVNTTIQEYDDFIKREFKEVSLPKAHSILNQVVGIS